MPLPRKGTPEYNVWILTPGYKERNRKISENNGGFPKKGTPEYEKWVLTPEYKKHCKICYDAVIGHVPSKETREKTSATNTGKHVHTVEWRRERSEKMLGKNNPMFEKQHTEEARALMIKNRVIILSGENHPMFGLLGEDSPNFGSHRSEESRKLMSIRKIGKYIAEENPNWRGGLSFEPYPQEFDDDFKKQIRMLFGNMCVFPGCGITVEENEEELSVHHYDYNKKSLNCVPLCRGHNTIVNYNRNEWEEYFIWFTRMYKEWYGRWKCVVEFE